MTTTTPEFPMARAARCPFDPPPELRDLQKEGPLAKIRLVELQAVYSTLYKRIPTLKLATEGDGPGADPVQARPRGLRGLRAPHHMVGAACTRR